MSEPIALAHRLLAGLADRETMTSNAPPAADRVDYVGIRRCGCVTAVAWGEAERRLVELFRRDMTNTGRTVKRLRADVAAERLAVGCPHGDGRR